MSITKTTYTYQDGSQRVWYGPLPSPIPEEWLKNVVSANDEQVPDPQDGNTQALIDRLWTITWEWAWNQLAAQDQTVITGWMAAGKLNAEGAEGYQALIAWQDAVFLGAYARAKEQIVARREWVPPDFTLWPPCPHDFLWFYSRRTA